MRLIPRATSSPRPRSIIKGNQALATLTQDSRNAGSPSDGREPDGQEPDGQEPDGQEPDVVLDVPELEVDSITLEVCDLRAHVTILVELANLLNISVGVDARLDEVKLEIEGVEAEVHLVARLKNVRAILVKALETIGEHPEILHILARSLSRLATRWTRRSWAVEGCRKLLRKRGTSHTSPERKDQRERRTGRPGRRPGFDREATAGATWSRGAWAASSSGAA